MLKFKKIEFSDIEIFKKYAQVSERFSCESNFVNLLVWQKVYRNMYAVYDDMLFIKSGKDGKETYRLPFGGDLSKGLEVLRKYTGTPLPPLWVQECRRLDELKALFGKDYAIIPERDAFDYIYLRDDLASLSGKKYHSKRNHISAFSKKYNWEFKEITDENIPDVLKCAEEWYAQNAQRFDRYMQCEKDGIRLMLENMQTLKIKGGAIYVEGKMVAFTLGSPINSQIFDTHIEKALPEYATAYTVINNEFAKMLDGYKYINREDDMGLEGLRRAKLSYKPDILLKKYFCIPKKQACMMLYNEAFGEEDNTFAERLFESNFKHCRYLEKDGNIVAICFAFPCKIKQKDALYIFAVTTANEYRKQGYAKELLEKIKNETDAVLILRPVGEELISFYERLDFKCFTATNEPSDFELKPADDFFDLAKDYKEKSGEYTAMYYSKEYLSLEKIYFPYSMP